MRLLDTLITYHLGGWDNVQKIGRYTNWRTYYTGRVARAWRCNSIMPIISYKYNKRAKNREKGARRRELYGTSALLGNPEDKRKKKTALYKKQGGRCLWCNKHMPYEKATIDHVVRITDGGTGCIENLQLLHRHCHDKKEVKYDRTRAKESRVSLNQAALDRIEWGKLSKENEAASKK